MLTSYEHLGVKYEQDPGEKLCNNIRINYCYFKTIFLEQFSATKSSRWAYKEY